MKWLRAKHEGKCQFKAKVFLYGMEVSMEDWPDLEGAGVWRNSEEGKSYSSEKCHQAAQAKNAYIQEVSLCN